MTMTDEKRTCQCVDHRIRKHDCKHIRLMLQTLGIPNSPAEWYAAAQRLVTSQASGERATADPGDTGPAASAGSKRARTASKASKPAKQPGQAFL